MSYVKTPLVQKASMKIAEPPMGLPIERIISPDFVPEDTTRQVAGSGKKSYMTDSGQEISHSGDDEQDFA